MNEITLTENTIIKIGKSMQGHRAHAFLEEITGKSVSGWEMKPWLATQEGKTIKETIASFIELAKSKKTEERLLEERFDFISEADKAFIAAFDKNIGELEYDCGGSIGEGGCWGNYMIIYTQTGVKSKKVIARIYIRGDGIVLRLFFSAIDKHRAYVENTPEHIKSVFTNNHGNCRCNPRYENCKHRKTYSIDGKKIEKCDGYVFEFSEPTVEKLPDYMSLLTEFYMPGKTARA